MRRAFTLIELLVVISIIALLIAILLPMLGSVQESSRRLQCASNQRMLTTSAISDAIENNGYLFRTHRWIDLPGDSAATRLIDTTVESLDDHASFLNLDLYNHLRDDYAIELSQFTCPNRGDDFINQPASIPSAIRTGFYFFFGRYQPALPNPSTNPLHDWDTAQNLDDPSDLPMTGDIIEWNTVGTEWGSSVSNASHGAKSVVHGIPFGAEEPSEIGSQGGNQSFLDGSAQFIAQDQMNRYLVRFNGGNVQGYFKAPESRRK